MGYSLYNPPPVKKPVPGEPQPVTGQPVPQPMQMQQAQPAANYTQTGATTPDEKYCGPISILICLFVPCGCFVAACPQDVKPKAPPPQVIHVTQTVPAPAQA